MMKTIKNDLGIMFWLGSLLENESEDMHLIFNSIKNMDEDELHELAEMLEK